MTQANPAMTAERRRAQIEATLAAYPDLPRERLDEVIAWFRKEATAHDVGMVASNPEIEASYRLFRADHIDRLTWRDSVYAIAFAAVVAVALAAILWRAF